MALRRRIVVLALLFVFTALPLNAQTNRKDSITLAIPPDGLSIEERAPLQVYLTKKMGRDVKLVIPNNYNEYLDGFANSTIDFACLGGVNYVRRTPNMESSRSSSVLRICNTMQSSLPEWARPSIR